MGVNKQAVRCLRMINKKIVQSEAMNNVENANFRHLKINCLHVNLGIGSNETAKLFLIWLRQITNFAQKRSVERNFEFSKTDILTTAVILEPKVKSQF